MRPARLLVAAGLAAAAAILLAAALLSRTPERAAQGAVAPITAANLPETPKAAFEIGAPVKLARHDDETTWAAVRRDVVARARPSRSAPRVGTLLARTPEDTTNIVLPRHAPARRRRAVGPAAAARAAQRDAGLGPALGARRDGHVRTRVIVDITTRRLTLLRDGREVMRVPVGVGTADAPTPRGEFVIRNRLTRFANEFYGPIALGTSARSATLTDWPGGGYVGIHGTNQPELIPGDVSHGCIRLRNADIVRLARELPIGTPITIS